MIPYISVQTLFQPLITFAQTASNISSKEVTNSPVEAPKSLDVPFYSQLKDIQSPDWRKRGCGVASLAMLIEYYKPGTVSVNTLLKQAIVSGAYLQNAGWKHRDLALLSKKYGLSGQNYDLSGSTKDVAFAEISEFLKDGPVMASIYYKFDPKSTIPHLVVINNIVGDTVYYNDPAEENAGKQISTDDFRKGWKKRFIVVRPTNNEVLLAKK